MMWVIVFIAIALGGFAMLVCFAIWLWRKTTALFNEVEQLTGLVGELGTLVGQIGLLTEGEDFQEFHSVAKDGDGNTPVTYVSLSHGQAT